MTTRESYDWITQQNPEAAITALAGQDEEKRALVLETLRLAAMFGADDWDFMWEWLAKGV